MNTAAQKCPITSALKEHFGFGSFRPFQREIIENILAGRDAIALLPTGGGKSLCYQLPALIREGLAVVVSPLIALMKDQVDSLQENGIAAAFLNSSLTDDQSREIWRQLHRGEIKILYLAPERLLVNGMLETLAALNLSFVAVDEAHCISSWGHDFRPEYRALSAIRTKFPNVPILALTATATERVRADIETMLNLQTPQRIVASFNRPNLSYRVVPRASPIKQIKEILEAYPGESGIIYCLSRARTESVAEELKEAGVKAEAYHAGLASEERNKRQKRFVLDQTQVMVATVAFGMGVHKPDVRFVIHHDLPKNIESYYQETGRAGRDGLPGECVLLFSPADAAKLRSFIDDATDEHEREISHTQLTQMLQFAESSVCRRVTLLRYFGEQYQNESGDSLEACGACDNCLTPRELIDGTEIAQKILSCLIRIQQRNHFSVGLGHVVDVLLGAQTQKVKKWGHENLSTYGVGKDRTRTEWIYFGRELISSGLLRVDTGRFDVLDVTDSGMDFLKKRRTIQLRAPLKTASLSVEKRRQQKRKLGEQDFDHNLFEELRNWRVSVARKKGLPAYMVFSDSTLQAVAREKPINLDALSEISGVGEKKLAQYGKAILALISEKHSA